MTETEQRLAARQFAAAWAGKGDEKQETQSFWMSLLRNVYGVAEPEKIIDFEVPVKLDHTSFIDGLIRDTRVLIEQKGADVDLHKPGRQSDGSLLTPFQQARRYAGYLPHDQNPRWIVVSNFVSFEIHDMNRPNDEPEVVALAELEREYHRLQFLVDTGDENIKKEMEVSLKAGEIVGVLYDALLRQYKDPAAPETLKSLNALCVRLVFCLYAEDAGIFGGHGMFHDYLRDVPASGVRKALVELFRILDTPPERRDKYLADDDPRLAAFPYVNGGLFSDEDVEVPPFTAELKQLLLADASENFNWSAISPTIFGAVFESTLNPETRRSGGMHYTSIENIHKVIDPLFLDGLKAEFAQIEAIAVEKTRQARLTAFQEKLAGLTFLDPACGSGNFLTETYLSLRRLENEAIAARQYGQVVLGGVENPIRVSIGQFYGIEINDFAVTVAKTALWIAESQMMRETEAIVRHELDFLPLKTNAHIVEGNALRLDWESVVPKGQLRYIMGNPPFVGASRLTEDQKKDREALFCGAGGELDYVSCWYKKTAEYISNSLIKCAFVSTNSICQGQQVAPLWKPLFSSGIRINFAHRTFVWESESTEKASVYCVIIGFSMVPSENTIIYTEGRPRAAKNINGYLMDAPNVFVEKRRLPMCAVPVVIKGLQPTDNGHLILNDAEKKELLDEEPEAEKWIRPFITAKEYIHGINRWCLWLKGISPHELNALPKVKQRVELCKTWRMKQPVSGDAYKLRDFPTLMRPSSKFTEGAFIVLPRHSGEKRKYIPFGFASAGNIPGDSVSIVPNANHYHFGILSSNVHMAWTRAICGRIKSDYRYTSDIVYNNFPWPEPTEEQKQKIQQTAQAILDARALYPDSSLADLYDETTMPYELRKAHRENDKAVWAAYGKAWPIGSESACVAALMKLYQALAGGGAP